MYRGGGIWGYVLKTKLYDEVKARLFFANNIEATCSVSWLSPVKRLKLTVVGSKYSVVLDDILDSPAFAKTSAGKGKISVYKDGNVLYPSYKKGSSLENELKAFIDVVKNNKRQHITDVKNGLIVVNILSVIEKSMEFDGKKIRC